MSNISIDNRFYGLAIGGAIGDAMGSVIEYSPNTYMKSPADSMMCGIQPGYWTEPTGLWLASVFGKPPWSSTGVFSNTKVNRHILLARLAGCSGRCIKYYDNIAKLLDVPDEIEKLWILIIDGILHHASKKSVFSPMTYEGLNFSLKTLRLLNTESVPELGTGSDTDSDYFHISEVLKVFKETNNYTEGLWKIINNSIEPSWTGTLYGQLAGAYYGLTDIPELWMDYVKESICITNAVQKHI